MVRPSSENSVSAWRSRTKASEGVVDVLGRRLPARDHLDLAATQAGGDLQRVQVDPRLARSVQRRGDLRLGDPEQPQHLGAVGRVTGDRGLQQRAAPRALPHRLELSRRPRQHDDQRAVGALGRRHDEPGRGPHRVEDLGAHRHDRLLAVGGQDRLLVQARPAPAQPAQDHGDLLFGRGVEHHLATLEGPHQLRGAVVLGRSQAAAGHDHVQAGVGKERQRGAHVLVAVGDDDRVRVVDAQLGQALGDPSAVAVQHAAGQHLGAGDHDAGASAHPAQVGRLLSGTWRAPDVVSW